MRIPIFIAAALTVFPQPGQADSAADFDKIVETCKAGKDQALACEKAVWDFADVAKDGKLTVAELARLARLFGESVDRRMAKERKAQPNTGGGATGSFGSQAGSSGGEMSSVPVALLLGPLSAQLLISNFDYDGDGSISRKELYADLPEGKFTTFVAQLTQSGKQAFGQASGSMFGLWAQNALGVEGGGRARRPGSSSGSLKLAPAPPPAPNVASAPGAADLQAGTETTAIELVTWSAAFHAQKPTAYYAIDYTLRNNRGKPVRRIDGVIEFRDPDGTAFMSIQIAEGKAVPAGASQRFAGNYPVSEAKPAQMKLRNLNKQTVRAVLLLKRVVFADNAVQQF